MTCPHCRDAGDFFSDWIAKRELRRYHRKGPSRTTRMLLDALIAEGVTGRDLLDIGGGVGVVQHELLALGAERAISAEAAPAYQELSRRETERRGHAARVEHWLGDFVEMAAQVPDAHIVTLDRVICCYPDMPALVGESAAHARELWGAVLPRERGLVRNGMKLVNLLLRLRKSAFRTYLHPAEGVADVLRSSGFELRHHRTTTLWQVMVWRRREA